MTRLFAIRAMALATTVHLTCGASAAETTWLSDVDTGKQLAAKQEKDLLVIFTGTEWCGACVALEREILSKFAFAVAGDDFVLVKLEFPANHDDLPAEIRPKYKSWRDRYGIRAYPTVLLTDPAGRPFAATGYERMTPEEYVARLHKLRQTRKLRDTALKHAATAAGLAKAKLLDEALTAVNDSFDASKTEGNSNPLVAYYRSEVDQILALAVDSQAGLAVKYQQLLEAESEQQAVKDFYARIDAIRKEKGLAAALEAHEEELANATSTLLRSRIRLSRLAHLGWTNRSAAYLALAEELLLDDSFSREDKRNIRMLMANVLRHLNRVDESIALWDQLISEVEGDRELSYRYCRGKADVLQRAKRFDEAAQARMQARPFTDVKTTDWFDNEVLLARVLILANRPGEAVDVLNAVLKTHELNKPERAVVLAELAVALDKDGHRDEALKSIDAAIAQWDRLIAETKGDKQLSYRYCYDKEQAWLRLKRFDDAVQARLDARPFAAGTRHWFDNEVRLARVLILANRASEAVDVLNAVLKSEEINKADRAITLADLAIALDKDGRRDEALKLISQVEELVAELESDDSARSRVQIAKRRLESLRQDDKP